MKTRILITAALIITMGVAHAAMPASLIFNTNEGKELVQPVTPEDATEALPLEVRQEMEKSQDNLIYYHFDITNYLLAEEEEPLPFDLYAEFLKAKQYMDNPLNHTSR